MQRPGAIAKPTTLGEARHPRHCQEVRHDSVPADLRDIVDRDAVRDTTAINPWVTNFNVKVREAWKRGRRRIDQSVAAGATGAFGTSGERRR
jgi:hypothetical protein